jgi:hypothetical protein
MNMKPLAIAFALASLAACHGKDPQAEARAQAAQQAQHEAAATDAAKAFDAAVVQQNWRLAKAQGDVLIAQFPQSQAAQRVRAQLGGIKARADAAREGERTAALWSYDKEAVKGGGTQLSASIYSRDPVDTGGGAQPVRLIFRDHPDWGRSSYLVLGGGDFDKACYGHCKVMVTVDGQAPKAMAANRPKTDEAVAMFIDDYKGLWKLAKSAKALTIEFPVKGYGKKTAVFETAGLDATQLPKWN